MLLMIRLLIMDEIVIFQSCQFSILQIKQIGRNDQIICQI